MLDTILLIIAIAILGLSKVLKLIGSVFIFVGVVAAVLGTFSAVFFDARNK